MARAIFRLLACFNLAAATFAQVVPSDSSLEFQNSLVRIVRVKYKPHQKTAMHDHPSTPTVFVYVTNGGRLHIGHEGEEPAIRPPVKAGAIRFQHAMAERHTVDELDGVGSEYLLLELKTQPSDQPPTEVRREPDDRTPYESPTLRIYRVTCPAHAMCPPSAHPEDPAVVVTGRDFRWMAANAPPVENTSAIAWEQIRVEIVPPAKGSLKPAMAQPPQAIHGPLPEFDAAYIEPTPVFDLDVARRPNGVPLPGLGLRGGPGTKEPGQLVCSHCSLEQLVGAAYEKRPQAVTVLNWMSYELYDLVAKVPPGSTAHDSHLMLQQFLSERFHLTVHHVSRELPGVVMKVGKRPLKLQSLPASKSVVTASRRPGLNPFLEDCLYKVAAKENTMSELADLLSREGRTAVVDRTGLEGRYQFSLAWFPSPNLAGEGRCAPKHMAAGRDAFDAVEKQIGLKIEHRKLPDDAVIVDSALKVPTGN